MNILFVGDPHFKIKNLEIVPLFQNKILDIINIKNPDLIVLGGDILDNHETIDVDSLNAAVEFIFSISQTNLVFIIVGNHDYKNNQQFLTKNHWMNSLKKCPNITIVDNVIEWKNFIFVPYTPPGRFIEALNLSDLSWKTSNAIFAHQEFYGCRMGSISSTVGDKWDIEWPLIVSGHIHNKQWLQKNVYYPGSAIQHAFGQSQNNTISMLSFYDNNFTFEEINLEMPKLYIKYCDLKNVESVSSMCNTDLKKHKLVLTGTLSEIKIFKKHSIYKNLLNNNISISFKNSSPIENKYEKCEKFITILKKNIDKENDVHLNELFNMFITKLI